MSAHKFRTFLPLFDELRGERVIVRPYRESDAQALQEAVAESRDNLRPWMPFADEHQTVDESRDWIIHQIAGWLTRESLVVGFWDAATQRYLGGSGYHVRDWEIGYYEIGYWIRVTAEGHGYVTETIRLLTDYAFETLKANRLEIRCDELNVRSAAIPRRLGYIEEGLLRNDTITPGGDLRNTLVFSLITGEWPRER
ncbi:MAG TPA: GNAT family protein [Ktedonobacteraceae bacterium]|nr:GNAT family protein [Ktedonobacteraceae bacterium]